MALQYKPTKPKKEKPQKTPKEPKREKEVKLGGAVKLSTAKPEKQKKIKEPKIKAQKAEKIQPVNIQKPEKAEKFEASGKFRNPTRSKTIAIALSAVAVLTLSLALIFFLPGGGGVGGIGGGEQTIVPSSLAIASMPDKTTFYVGEAPVFTGLELKLTLSNGTVLNVGLNECEITGFDSSAPAENQEIIIQYKELKTRFSISIKEINNDKPTGKYCGLSFKTLPKTEYKIGDWFDASGGVLLVHYDDGTTREIELKNEYVYDFYTGEPGTYTLTVKYVERGSYYSTTYDITVTE